ncbi:MAG TPA: hypothetical protein VFV87_19880, partial [Pirellulaceae bacterium]|nr:hypothetical protein [Pirellulaceae bacterium]
IAVNDSAGRPVKGAITLEDQERCWLFRSDRPWSAGRHELVIDTTLEDLAGNRIGRPFEVDELRPIEKQVIPEFYRLPVKIVASSK